VSDVDLRHTVAKTGKTGECAYVLFKKNFKSSIICIKCRESYHAVSSVLICEIM